MTHQQLIQRAKEKNVAYLQQRNMPAFQKTMALFTHLGLLQHNRIKPVRCKVTFEEVMTAAQLEPRILEILPAVLTKLPEAVTVRPEDLPQDLKDVLNDIATGKPTLAYKYVKPEDYTQWLNAPCIAIAKKRLNFRKTPRTTFRRSTELSEVIKAGRTQLTLTQKEFAELHGISLGVLRDVEQGKTSVSYASVEKILRALGRKISF